MKTAFRPCPSKIAALILASIALAETIAHAEKTATPTPNSSHWSFQPIRNPPPPSVTNSAWSRASIDPFVLDYLERHQASPAPPANRRALLRRATFDLTGLPPTALEIDAFLSDASPNAFAKVVDRLLASPRYGERWGRHWLDVVRYADTAGETADYPVLEAWRFRNYVIDAFNADKPYDEFLREQIAGDILARSGPRERYAERMVATGFLALSRRFGFDSENYHHLTIQDTIDTLGQSVLGLSLGCARCHNHKYDPIPATDYYALYGIFESTRYAFPGSEQKQKYRALAPLIPPEESRPQWRAFEARVNQLARQLENAKQSVPPAILRSMDDFDGDFEMQAPAAGGSRGVLVPPWISEGVLAVTREAQSPFTNLFQRGRVGMSVPSGANAYWVAQTFHPAITTATAPRLEISFDFRIAGDTPNRAGQHRLRWGPRDGVPALELLLSANAILHRTDERVGELLSLRTNEWYQARLEVDLADRSVSGHIASLTESRAFGPLALSPSWSGTIDEFRVESAQPPAARPRLDFDQWTLNAPSPPLTKPSVDQAKPNAPTESNDKDAIAAWKAELNALLERGPFDLAYAVVEGTPRNARLQIRGEPERPGPETPRGFLSLFPGSTLPATARGSGRLELANWLTRPGFPLTARVMVNRIWQYHFGKGLVATPNDFGTRGQPPVLPDLLDHLASRFVASGWSVKAIHRLILNSAAYQQSSPSSLVPPVPTPGVGDFAAFARRRLGAEETRDAMLFVSGGLDMVPGRGHPFPHPVGWGYTQHGPFAAIYDHDKRGIYLMTQRIKRHPFLALFDGPDPNASTAERRPTTVPTQALFFLNDTFVHTQAERLARNIRQAASIDRDRIEWAYRQTLGRPADDLETREGLDFLAVAQLELSNSGVADPELGAMAAMVRVLFASNEFLTVD